MIKVPYHGFLKHTQFIAITLTSGRKKRAGGYNLDIGRTIIRLPSHLQTDYPRFKDAKGESLSGRTHNETNLTDLTSE